MNAYQEGKEAFINWIGLYECPYVKWTDEYEDWVSGWFDAHGEHTDIIYGD